MHGTTAKQIVHLQKNGRQQFSFALVEQYHISIAVAILTLLIFILRSCVAEWLGGAESSKRSRVQTLRKRRS
jgi:hypothetical protein